LTASGDDSPNLVEGSPGGEVSRDECVSTVFAITELEVEGEAGVARGQCVHYFPATAEGEGREETNEEGFHFNFIK
jgi:hypothetical protein